MLSMLGFDELLSLQFEFNFNEFTNQMIIEKIYQCNSSHVWQRPVPKFFLSRFQNYANTTLLSSNISQLFNKFLENCPSCPKIKVLEILKRKNWILRDAISYFYDNGHEDIDINDNNSPTGRFNDYNFVKRMIESSPDFWNENSLSYTNIFNILYHLIIREIQSCYERCILCNESIPFIGKFILIIIIFFIFFFVIIL